MFFLSPYAGRRMEKNSSDTLEDVIVYVAAHYQHIRDLEISTSNLPHACFEKVAFRKINARLKMEK